MKSARRSSRCCRIGIPSRTDHGDVVWASALRRDLIESVAAHLNTRQWRYTAELNICSNGDTITARNGPKKISNVVMIAPKKRFTMPVRFVIGSIIAGSRLQRVRCAIAHKSNIDRLVIFRTGEDAPSSNTPGDSSYAMIRSTMSCMPASNRAIFADVATSAAGRSSPGSRTRM